MSKPSYYELLRHPSWQKKRLEVMERAGFECEECGEKDTTLNVHHSYYEKGKKPWEYPDESLHCLCESCHCAAQKKSKKIERLLSKVSNSDEIIGYLKAIILDEASDADHNPTTGDPIVFNSEEEVWGFVSYFGRRDRKAVEYVLKFLETNKSVMPINIMYGLIQQEWLNG